MFSYGKWLNSLFVSVFLLKTMCLFKAMGKTIASEGGCLKVLKAQSHHL